MNKLKIVIFIFSFLTNSITFACPDGSIQGITSDICYYLVKNQVTWLSAEKDCIQKGGHITSIQDSFEVSLLRSLAQAEDFDGFWLGSTNTIELNIREWMDGVVFKKYQNWGTGMF